MGKACMVLKVTETLVSFRAILGLWLLCRVCGFCQAGGRAGATSPCSHFLHNQREHPQEGIGIRSCLIIPIAGVNRYVHFMRDPIPSIARLKLPTSRPLKVKSIYLDLFLECFSLSMWWCCKALGKWHSKMTVEPRVVYWMGFHASGLKWL